MLHGKMFNPNLRGFFHDCFISENKNVVGLGDSIFTISFSASLLMHIYDNCSKPSI